MAKVEAIIIKGMPPATPVRIRHKRVDLSWGTRNVIFDFMY
jgi:hypothetical protein